MFELSQLAVTVAALIFVYFGPIRWRRQDDFRCEIRRIREELFDFMLENEIPFDNPAYVRTRYALNGLLRISGILSPVFFGISLYYRQLCRVNGHVLLMPEQLTANSALRDKILEVRHEASDCLQRHIFLQGFTGICVRVVLGLVAVSRNTARVRVWSDRRAEALLTVAGRYEYNHHAIAA